MCSAICWAHFHYCKEHCENKRLRKEDIIMKLSRYNIEKKEDKSCLIYNTVTSAILELDTDYEKSYYEMKEGKKCSKPDLESALLEGGMLVEDDKDEFAELLIRNKIERFADSNLTWRIKDQEELDLNPGEEFYIIELKNSSHLFSQAYSSYTEVIQEIQETFGELLPPDFPLDDFLVEIMGEVWG